MEKLKNDCCPDCGNNEFHSRPDTFTIYKGNGGLLHESGTEPVDDATEIRCSECNWEVPKHLIG